MAYDIGAVVLEWRNLDRLGIASTAMKSFDDTQFHFFQSFQAIPKKIKYAKPTLNNLKSKLRSISTHSASIKLIIHGVFVQMSYDKSCTSHLMSPLIYCLEMVFNETNKITAEHHLDVCLWLLSLYNNVCKISSEHYLNFNQCICETIKYHKDNNNLAIHGIETKHIKQQCYKNHLTPLKILLRNIHPKQRKCSTFDISKLIYSMLSELGIHNSLSTVYITMNDEQKISIENDDNGWSCCMCTLLNSNDKTVCEVCNTAKPRIKYDFVSSEPYRARKYKENMLNQCNELGVNIGINDWRLKINIHDMSIGHIRLLFQTGILPFSIRIKDEYTKIICNININELLTNFDKNFSILRHVNVDMLEDIYPLMVIHSESKKDLIRILSHCELCGSSKNDLVILRNYFSLISDYIFGDTFKNDNIYDNDIRVKYCQYHLDAAKQQKGVKNADFFIYWLSKYCITDTKFLNFYSKSQQLPVLKEFCSQRDELKPLLYQFDLDSYEKYNSYYYL
eukprot:120597_1